MLTCTLHKLGELAQYTFVAIVSCYQGSLLFSRHSGRVTWETQGGHIEPGETPEEAARRELFEESGALEYTLHPLCDYAAAGTAGVAYAAHIKTLGLLPPSEMAQVGRFNGLPPYLTYPGITPQLYRQARGAHPQWWEVAKTGEGNLDFTRQIAPFELVVYDTGNSLLLDVGSYKSEVFAGRADEGFEGNGYDWNSLAQVFLNEKMPMLKDELEFDPEAGMFCAYSKNPEALGQFALAFHAACEDDGMMRDLFSRAELD